MKNDGFKKALNSIREALGKISNETFQDIGEYTAKRIQMKSRQGKTTITGREEKMPALSPSYIEQRKRWKNAFKDEIKKLRKDKQFKQDDFNFGGRAHRLALGNIGATNVPITDTEFFSPARSNLTVTGQYNASIAVEKVDKSRNLITIAPVGMRKDGYTNKEIAQFLTKMGRSIWGLDQVGRNVIRQKVINELRRNLKKR